jgi:DNA-binding winged helix-turn-helix (wHTH) protein/Tfp pilus assembly protein PilF
MATLSILSGYRFGPFALDLRSGELTKNGRRIRLQEKPRSILIALAEHPGEVITRAELRERLWPDDTFVSFEDGLNTAMRKLREALDDDPQNPGYIETVRGRGYRLLVAVEPVAAEPGLHPSPGESHRIGAPHLASAPEAGGEAPIAPEGIAAQPSQAAGRRALPVWTFVLGCVVAAGGIGLWYWLAHGRPVLSVGSRDPVLVADFDNQTGDPRFDRALETALTVSLQQSRYLNLYSRLQAQSALRLMSRKETDPITAAVGREICQRENLHALVLPGITRAGHEYRLTAELIDPATGIAVRSYSESASDENHILVALDSISTDIRRDLGESHYEIRQAHRALPEVTTASLEALEDYAEGSDLFGRGRADDAERLYKRAIAADPGFAMAHAALGYEYYSFFSNKPALGEQEYQTALALAPRTTEREHAWIEVRYAESQGRIKDALALYRLYLQTYPGDWPAQYSYARMLRMNGHAPDAVGIYQQLLREEPDAASTWIELATCYYDLSQWESSIQAYEKGFALDPSRMLVGNINHEYGFALVEAGQDAKAEQVFSATLAASSSYPLGERSLAYLDMYRGRFASARKRLMLALAATHDGFSTARIRYALASVNAAQGNRRDEADQLDRILAGFDALGQKVLYGSMLGEAYARAGDTGKARQILEKIAPVMNDRIEDQAAFVALLKAEVAEASGDAQGAVQFMKPPADADFGSAAVFTRESLAHLYQTLGNRDEAIAWYEQFVKGGSPGWEPQRYLPDAYYTLAEDYQQKGDRANALRCVSALLDEWKDADANLPLLQSARRLRDELTAKP